MTWIRFLITLYCCGLVAIASAQLTCNGDGRGAVLPATIPDPEACTTGTAAVAPVTSETFTAVDNGNLICSLNHLWHVDKRIVEPTTTETDVITGPYCSLGDTPLTVSYELLIDDREELTYYGVSGRLNLTLTNSGDCNASLVSILMLFERNNTPASGQESYGDEFDSHILISRIGVENSLTNNCPDTNSNTHETNVCFGSCGFEIAYTPNNLHDRSTELPLSLDGKSVAANGGQLDLELAFEFSLTENEIAQVLAHKSDDFRISILVTYDTCCGTANACDIDYDCDGQSNSVFTAQVRTPSLVWPSWCDEICGCLSVTQQNASAVGEPNGDCFQFSQVTSPLEVPSLLCSDLISSLEFENGCCTCSDQLQYWHNLAVASSEWDTCTDGLGRSLIQKSEDTIKTNIVCP